MKCVRARLTFDCGRCGATAHKIVETTGDGLLELPNFYCGKCVSKNRLTSVSMIISNGETYEIPNKEATVPGPWGHVQVFAAGSPAESLELAGVGRFGADTSVGKDQSTGGDGPTGVPPVPAKKGDKGK